jgi:hypothetical protein
LFLRKQEIHELHMEDSNILCVFSSPPRRIHVGNGHLSISVLWGQPPSYPVRIGGVFQGPDPEVPHSASSSAEVRMRGFIPQLPHSYLCHDSELSAGKPLLINLGLRIGLGLLV